MTSIFTLFHFIDAKNSELIKKIAELWRELPDAEKKVSI